MTDVPFTFFFGLALLFYLTGLRRNAYLILCGVAIGFAVLMRSFLGLIPLAVILAHLTITRRWTAERSKYFIAGALLALGLPLVWFVSQYQLHGSKFLALHFSFTFDNLPLTNRKRANQFGAGLFNVSALPDQILLALAAIDGYRDMDANEEGNQMARFDGQFAGDLGVGRDRSLQPGRVQMAALHHARVSGIRHSLRHHS